MVNHRRINLHTAWDIHYEEIATMEEILRQELEMVINREQAITLQEITVVETIRILAEDLGVCGMPDLD
jgi:hypothetical protein